MSKFKKTITKIILTTLSLGSLPSLAEVQTQIFGPKWSQRRYLSSLLTPELESKLTTQEMNEALNIFVYQDAQNPKLYYYIPPIVVSKWRENRYSLHLDVQERIYNNLMNLADGNTEQMRLLIAELISGSDIKNIKFDSFLSDISEANKAKMDIFKTNVNILRAFLPEMFANIPINSPEDALVLGSYILNRIPTTRASVSLGFGFTKARADVLVKVKSLHPDLKFMAIPALKEYVFTSNEGSTPSNETSGDIEEKLAKQYYKRRTDMVRRLFQPIIGLQVKPEGTIVGMDLNYNLVKGWGYSKDNPYAGAGGLYFEGGDFVTKFPITARFDGRIDCQFKGEIIKKKLFKYDQMEGLALMVDNSMDIEDAANANVTCELFDSKGNLLSRDGLIQSGSIDTSLLPPDMSVEKYATSLNSYIQDKIKQFTDENTKIYTAAQDLRDAIFQRAQENADGWLKFNIPMEEYQISKWVEQPQCRQFPVQGPCKRHGWKYGSRSKWLGDKWECKEYETKYDTECVNVPKLIYETFQRPMKIRGFAEEIPFVRNFDVKASYPISSVTQATVSVTAPNDACFARYEIENPTNNNRGRFAGCTGEMQIDIQQQGTVNATSEVTVPSQEGEASVAFPF